MTRNDKIFADIDRHGLGLEIGPSFNPVAPKRAGYRVETVDHLDRAGLIEKYAPHGVDVSQIEEVDHVWQGQPLSQLVGGGSRFDWIIASHVVEHTPNLIGFLNECGQLLKPTGALSLIVPDKRFCFDHFRPLSGIGEVIQASLEERVRHPPGWIFEYYVSAAALDGQIAWERGRGGRLNFIHTLATARQHFLANLAPDAPYADIHAWRFTPSSFRLLLHDLRNLELLALCESRFFDSTGCEFYITLRHGEPRAAIDRLQLSRNVQRELAEALF